MDELHEQLLSQLVQAKSDEEIALIDSKLAMLEQRKKTTQDR